MQHLQESHRVFYHASFNRIGNKFWPLSHFGTYKAAIHRIKNLIDDSVDDATPFQERNVYLYPVTLKIKNTLHTPDIYNERPFVVWEVATYIAKKFHKSLTDEQKHLVHILMKNKTTPLSCKRLEHLLSTLGYDGLSYTNKIEDPGHRSFINLNSNQAEIGYDPIVLKASEIYYHKKHKETKEPELVTEPIPEPDPIPEEIPIEPIVVNKPEPKPKDQRPQELGEAYFYANDDLIDIEPYTNHRDWLLKNSDIYGFQSNNITNVPWEAYKNGFIRLIWDQGGKWQSRVDTVYGNVLYINGFSHDIWRNIKNIMNGERWAGYIDTVVIEHLKEVDGKTNWYHTDIIKDNALESLYRGKKPKKELAPTDAIYGGDALVKKLVYPNRIMNNLNDKSEKNLIELFNQHYFTPNKFDIYSDVPQNKYVDQEVNYHIYS